MTPAETQAASRPGPRLSLGPIGYYWPKETVDAFYAQVAQLPVDIVYLGETLCSKHKELKFEDWLAIGERLVESGKEVVLSTLSLLEAESELIRLRSICDNGRFLVEANDMGAVNLLQGKPFVVGHSVNIYNDRSLALLARQGLKRWVLPVELTAETLADMQRQRPNGVETEVLAYGRLPLAYSARCFTARARNLPKDDCQYCCIDYPDGLVVATQDDQSFLALNGIQTLSARTANLLAELPRMRELNVDILRISPQAEHTDEIIRLFDQALRGELTPADAGAKATELTPSGACDGYWHGGAGMALQGAA
ncbi:ubiquinone anaerobic biosynthesis protein UbiV [Thiorhodovibrio frisius]|uniref:Ubiquinone biosynthesis protein UbiV n=1 Tax=Thiorhodovibrio frisius TaxID=631362 RepID=H8Z878_9GAMM|nr:U32 family peptidase [Thiorhodovibrio frisius]EIC21027.1 collagenase-like protease [Thiorhodovibrio frisius]WPL22083.1 putative protease [Thiorhodovibrio frisius]